jgi:hypothetical protein
VPHGHPLPAAIQRSGSAQSLSSNPAALEGRFSEEPVKPVSYWLLGKPRESIDLLAVGDKVARCIADGGQLPSVSSGIETARGRWYGHLRSVLEGAGLFP